MSQGMPVDLVLVRHGESEGNVAKNLSKTGDNSLLTQEFLARHNSTWRLTNLGCDQARKTGSWIRKQFPNGFFRYYTSDYLRSMETAAHLQIPDARWFVEPYFRERDYGDLDAISSSDTPTSQAERERKKRHPFYWTPEGGGESIASLCMRADRMLQTLARECSLQQVVIVNHGELMWAYRMRLLRMPVAEFLRLDASTHPHDRIHNCQVDHFTRRNPFDGITIKSSFGWWRSVLPESPELSVNDWQPIIRRTYSNGELLQEAGNQQRAIS